MLLSAWHFMKLSLMGSFTVISMSEYYINLTTQTYPKMNKNAMQIG